MAHYGGPAWQILCKSGPFGTVGEKVFVETLRSMGQQHLLMQAVMDCCYMASRRKDSQPLFFYTAFMTEEDTGLFQEEEHREFTR